jgi:membrane protein YdbS with pleckstrin-like domain
MFRKIAQWMVDHLFWDAGDAARTGFWGALWAIRKLLVALALATVLTWREWVEHHPPEIAVVAVIHFAFVLVVFALLVYPGQWFIRGLRKASSRQR